VQQNQNDRIALDPRTKSLLARVGAAVVVSARDVTALAVIGVVLVVWIACSGAARIFLGWLRLVLPMAFFFGLVTLWAFGATEGLIAGAKLLWLTVVGFLFFVNTAPEDLANALVKTGVPYKAAFVVSAAMQFVPILGRKARCVLEAQKARGLPLTGGWQAIRRYPAFLLPLLVQAFQLAEELAEAMECRGFGRSGRTFFKQFALRPLDYGVIIVSLAAAGLLIWGMQ
jgi:energy-coupling factor transport system permease protein